jgi:predicted signal transduction protein with EAL and GGDEF domain
MSWGFATQPAHGADAETLIRQADAAVYEAKRRRDEPLAGPASAAA